MKTLKFLFVLALALVVFIISVSTKILFFSVGWTIVSLVIILVVATASYYNYQLDRNIKDINLFFESLSDEDLDRFIECNDGDKFITDVLDVQVKEVHFELYNCQDCVFKHLPDCYIKIKEVQLVDICSKKGSVFVEV